MSLGFQVGYEGSHSGFVVVEVTELEPWRRAWFSLVIWGLLLHWNVHFVFQFHFFLLHFRHETCMYDTIIFSQDFIFILFKITAFYPCVCARECGCFCRMSGRVGDSGHLHARLCLRACVAARTSVCLQVDACMWMCVNEFADTVLFHLVLFPFPLSCSFNGYVHFVLHFKNLDYSLSSPHCGVCYCNHLYINHLLFVPNQHNPEQCCIPAFDIRFVHRWLAVEVTESPITFFLSGAQMQFQLYLN